MQSQLARTLTISSDESLSGPPLDVLADVWTHRRSGWLRVGPRRAKICNGGILDEAGEELLDLALSTSDGGATKAFVIAVEVRFDPADQEGLSDTLSVGIALWEAAMKEADPEFTEQVLYRVLGTNGKSEIFEELPLSEHTRSLLGAAADKTIGQNLSRLAIPTEGVSLELAALARLGLVHFRRYHEVAPVTPPSMLVEVEVAENNLTLRRLKRDMEALDEADEWDVLGIPAGSDLASIREAGERLRARYHKLVRDPRQPALVRQLSSEMITHIEQALESLTASPDEGPDLIEEEAWEAGRLAMDEGRIREAVAHFSGARARNKASSRDAGWLGWAIFWDEGRPAASRKQEAYDLLALSEQLGFGEMPDPPYFLAHILADRGDNAAAELRLSELLRRFPDHSRARRLFLKVRRQRSQGA